MIWPGGLSGAFTPFGVSRCLCSRQAVAWGEEGWVGTQCLSSASIFSQYAVSLRVGGLLRVYVGGFFFAFPHLFSLLQGKDFDLKQRVTRAASFLNPSWNRLVSNGAEVGGSPVHLP